MKTPEQWCAKSKKNSTRCIYRSVTAVIALWSKWINKNKSLEAFLMLRFTELAVLFEVTGNDAVYFLGYKSQQMRGDNLSSGCRTPGCLSDCPELGPQLCVSGPNRSAEVFSGPQADATYQTRDNTFTFHTLTQWCLKTMCTPPLCTSSCTVHVHISRGGLFFFAVRPLWDFIQECLRSVLEDAAVLTSSSREGLVHSTIALSLTFRDTAIPLSPICPSINSCIRPILLNRNLDSSLKYAAESQLLL